MIKTQIQLPDLLYREAKRLAEETEISFAEVVRRGLEEMIRVQPPRRAQAEEWTPPTPADLGAPLAPEQEWTALSHE